MVLVSGSEVSSTPISAFYIQIQIAFYSHHYRYQIIVESASDRREAFGVKKGNTMEFKASMKNISFSNFIQFQVLFL